MGRYLRTEVFFPLLLLGCLQYVQSHQLYSNRSEVSSRDFHETSSGGWHGFIPVPIYHGHHPHRSDSEHLLLPLLFLFIPLIFGAFIIPFITTFLTNILAAVLQARLMMMNGNNGGTNGAANGGTPLTTTRLKRDLMYVSGVNPVLADTIVEMWDLFEEAMADMNLIGHMNLYYSE